MALRVSLAFVTRPMLGLSSEPAEFLFPANRIENILMWIHAACHAAGRTLFWDCTELFCLHSPLLGLYPVGFINNSPWPYARVNLQSIVSLSVQQQRLLFSTARFIIFVSENVPIVMPRRGAYAPPPRLSPAVFATLTNRVQAHSDANALPCLTPSTKPRRSPGRPLPRPPRGSRSPLL